MITNTNEYQFSHGKKPRGLGNWCLRLTGTNGQGSYTTETFFVHGLLTEAKRDACRRFKNEVGGVKSIVECEVLP